MPIPFRSKIPEEFSEYSREELIKLNDALDKLIEEAKQFPFKEFERKIHNQKEQTQEVEFTAVKVLDKKIQLINEEKNIIVEEYNYSTQEEAINDFKTIVEILGLEIKEEGRYAT